MEPPWIPSSGYAVGLKGHSCMPLGEYRVTRYQSEAHQGAFAVSNPQLGVYLMPNDPPSAARAYAMTNVLIQPATWAAELRGGIALGKARAKGSDGLWTVQRSRDAMNELRNLLSRALEINLTITSGTVIA